MALQKDIDLESGLVVKDAYIRIVRIEGNKSMLTIVVNIYANREARLDRKPAVQSKVYNFTPSEDPDSFRWDKQGYQYLKTTNEYADAIDVLEDGQTA